MLCVCLSVCLPKRVVKFKLFSSCCWCVADVAVVAVAVADVAVLLLLCCCCCIAACRSFSRCMLTFGSLVMNATETSCRGTRRKIQAAEERRRQLQKKETASSNSNNSSWRLT